MAASMAYQLQAPWRRPVAKPALCIDIDNVLSQSDKVIRQLIFEHTSVKLEYTHVVHYEYHRCRDDRGRSISVDEWHAVHDAFSDPDVIRSLDPIEDVQAHLSDLTHYYELHLVTSRNDRAHAATREWLHENRFPPHALHFIRRGSKSTAVSAVIAAVEDDAEEAGLFAEAGIPCFLLEHPWNATPDRHPKIVRLPDWEAIKDALVELSRTKRYGS
jgi:uncharacterized HAD superfamily protein